MSFITWIIVGLIAGLLADWVMPGANNWVVDTLVGMAGAIIGGWLFSLLGMGGATGFNFWSILVAFIGAVILLGIVRAIQGRKV